MSNNRTLVGVVIGAVVLCLCLVCVALALAAYFFFPQGLTTGSTSGEFSGYYTSGFEVSSFVPCAEAGPAASGEAWWLGGAAESGFYDQYLDVIGPDAGEYVTVFVVWRGTVSPPGTYGHLGAYTREATVEEVIEMSLDGTC